MLSLLYLSPVSSHHCILGWMVWYLQTEHGMRRCGERRLCPWWSSMASHPPHHRVHRPGGMAPCRSSWAHTQVWPLWNILLANPCFHACMKETCTTTPLPASGGRLQASDRCCAHGKVGHSDQCRSFQLVPNKSQLPGLSLELCVLGN